MYDEPFRFKVLKAKRAKKITTVTNLFNMVESDLEDPSCWSSGLHKELHYKLTGK